MKADLREIYEQLYRFFGPQHWWPGETPFEILLGAVLAQNTNWQNASRAIENLREEGLLSFTKIDSLPVEILAEKIRPSGYYNQKALRIRNLLTAIKKTVAGLDVHGDPGNDEKILSLFFAHDSSSLRQVLLAVKGIGPETADSILLYAGEKPVFVVDAYTHRIITRHSILDEEAGYEEIQAVFMDNLEHDTNLFNEYHALIVKTGKEFCKKNKPICHACPLKDI